jgi:hypothetical protein
MARLTVFGNFDSEGEFVSDSHCLDFAGAAVQDADPRWRCFGGRGDADHFWISAKEENTNQNRQRIKSFDS